MLITVVLHLCVLISSGWTQRRSFDNGKSNNGQNNYWYHYWYNDNNGQGSQDQGNNHQQQRIPSSNEVRKTYEWHSGNTGQNGQNWGHQEKRDLFQIPGGLLGNPGLKNSNTNTNYFTSWFSNGNNDAKDSKKVFDQQNSKWFRNWQNTGFQTKDNNFQRHHQRKDDSNDNQKWRHSFNNQWQSSDGPNFDQNNNFPQNNQNRRHFNNFDSDEDFSGPNVVSEDDSNQNSLPESSSTPPLSFWIGVPPPNYVPMSNSDDNQNQRPTNWFRPGILRRNITRRIDTSVDTSGSNPSVPIEDDLGQIDLLVEAERVCGAGSNVEEDTETSIRIARGHEATEMYPWLVAIYQAAPGKQMQFICGGSLITTKHAISAAHCFVLKDTMSYEFIVSNNRILKPSEAQDTLRKAESIMLHPGYNPLVTPANSDVAVIVFERPVQFGLLIKPICMWRGDSSIRGVTDEIGRIVGWGANEHLAIADELPMEINMGIIDYRTCIQRDNSFVNVVGANSFCSGYRNGSGPCMGDSGSGFMLKQNGRWSLRGVVSLTTKLVGCDINHYVGLTDVAKYHNWLLSVLRRR